MLPVRDPWSFRKHAFLRTSANCTWRAFRAFTPSEIRDVDSHFVVPQYRPISWYRLSNTAVKYHIPQATSSIPRNAGGKYFQPYSQGFQFPSRREPVWGLLPRPASFARTYDTDYMEVSNNQGPCYRPQVVRIRIYGSSHMV